MPVLEVRRHSIRKTTGGSQLSQEGVELARRLGQDMGPFAVVATSVVPRARETAIAMGFAVDQELITLSADPGFWTDVESSGWWLDPQPFKAFEQALIQPGPYRDYAHSMASTVARSPYPTRPRRPGTLHRPFRRDRGGPHRLLPRRRS